MNSNNNGGNGTTNGNGSNLGGNGGGAPRSVLTPLMFTEPPGTPTSNNSISGNATNGQHYDDYDAPAPLPPMLSAQKFANMNGKSNMNGSMMMRVGPSQPMQSPLLQIPGGSMYGGHPLLLPRPPPRVEDDEIARLEKARLQRRARQMQRTSCVITTFLVLQGIILLGVLGLTVYLSYYMLREKFIPGSLTVDGDLTVTGSFQTKGQASQIVTSYVQSSGPVSATGLVSVASSSTGSGAVSLPGAVSITGLSTGTSSTAAGGMSVKIGTATLFNGTTSNMRVQVPLTIDGKVTTSGSVTGAQGFVFTSSDSISAFAAVGDSDGTSASGSPGSVSTSSKSSGISTLAVSKTTNVVLSNGLFAVYRDGIPVFTVGDNITISPLTPTSFNGVSVYFQKVETDNLRIMGSTVETLNNQPLTLRSDRTVYVQGSSVNVSCPMNVNDQDIDAVRRLSITYLQSRSSPSWSGSIMVDSPLLFSSSVSGITSSTTGTYDVKTVDTPKPADQTGTNPGDNAVTAGSLRFTSGTGGVGGRSGPGPAARGGDGGSGGSLVFQAGNGGDGGTGTDTICGNGGNGGNVMFFTGAPGLRGCANATGKSSSQGDYGRFVIRSRSSYTDTVLRIMAYSGTGGNLNPQAAVIEFDDEASVSNRAYFNVRVIPATANAIFSVRANTLPLINALPNGNVYIPSGLLIVNTSMVVGSATSELRVTANAVYIAGNAAVAATSSAVMLANAVITVDTVTSGVAITSQNVTYSQSLVSVTPSTVTVAGAMPKTVYAGSLFDSSNSASLVYSTSSRAFTIGNRVGGTLLSTMVMYSDGAVELNSISRVIVSSPIVVMNTPQMVLNTTSTAGLAFETSGIRRQDSSFTVDFDNRRIVSASTFGLITQGGLMDFSSSAGFRFTDPSRSGLTIDSVVMGSGMRLNLTDASLELVGSVRSFLEFRSLSRFASNLQAMQNVTFPSSASHFHVDGNDAQLNTDTARVDMSNGIRLSTPASTMNVNLSLYTYQLQIETQAGVQFMSSATSRLIFPNSAQIDFSTVNPSISFQSASSFIRLGDLVLRHTNGDAAILRNNADSLRVSFSTSRIDSAASTNLTLYSENSFVSVDAYNGLKLSGRSGIGMSNQISSTVSTLVVDFHPFLPRISTTSAQGLVISGGGNLSLQSSSFQSEFFIGSTLRMLTGVGSTVFEVNPTAGAFTFGTAAASAGMLSFSVSPTAGASISYTRPSSASLNVLNIENVAGSGGLIRFNTLTGLYIGSATPTQATSPTTFMGTHLLIDFGSNAAVSAFSGRLTLYGDSALSLKVGNRGHELIVNAPVSGGNVVVNTPSDMSLVVTTGSAFNDTATRAPSVTVQGGEHQGSLISNYGGDVVIVGGKGKTGGDAYLLGGQGTVGSAGNVIVGSDGQKVQLARMFFVDPVNGLQSVVPPCTGAPVADGGANALNTFTNANARILATLCFDTTSGTIKMSRYQCGPSRNVNTCL
eukprot:ANDGO_00966.mRNA.1 hypothetical protein